MEEATMLNNWTRILVVVVLVVMGIVLGVSLSDPAWAQRAANVKDVENPDKLPRVTFVKEATYDVGTTYIHVSMDSAVPSGKRWIIENVSALIQGVAGQSVYLDITVGSVAGHILLVSSQGTDVGGHDIFVASQPMKLRLSAGEKLTFTLNRNSSSGQGKILVTATGYEIDYP
jgi:hypothetical protein